MKKFINLLPPEEKQAQFQNKAKVYSLAVLVLFIALFGGFEWYKYNTSNSLSESKHQLAQLDSKKVNLDFYKEEEQRHHALINTLENRDFPLYNLLHILSHELPEDLWLYNVTSLDFYEESITENDEVAEEDSVEEDEFYEDEFENEPIEDENVDSEVEPPITFDIPEGMKNNNENRVVVRGAGTSPNQIGQLVSILEKQSYVKEATLLSVEEYSESSQVYQAFEIYVEGH